MTYTVQLPMNCMRCRIQKDTVDDAFEHKGMPTLKNVTKLMKVIRKTLGQCLWVKSENFGMWFLVDSYLVLAQALTQLDKGLPDSQSSR